MSKWLKWWWWWGGMIMTIWEGQEATGLLNPVRGVVNWRNHLGKLLSSIYYS